MMGLFAFSQSMRQDHYKDSLNDGDTRNLSSQFKKEALEIYYLPQEGQLIQIIQTGAAALKTIHCVDAETAERECATCDPIVRMIAKNLPNGHTRQSQIRCSATKMPISEKDHPFRMPTGYIIAESTIKKLVQTADGSYQCPVTGKHFRKEDLKRVFFS